VVLTVSFFSKLNERQSNRTFFNSFFVSRSHILAFSKNVSLTKKIIISFCTAAMDLNLKLHERDAEAPQCEPSNHQKESGQVHFKKKLVKNVL
jgi:hypothetical protein